MTSLHSDEYRRFVEALRAAREAAGVTQKDLAARLGMEQPYVSKYEKGRQRLDVIEFLRIAAALKFDPTAFLASFRGNNPTEIKP